VEGYLQCHLLASEGQAGRKAGERQAMADQPGRAEVARAQEIPDGGLLGEAPGIGADQPLFVLEEVVERETGGFAGAAVGEEDRRPARTERGEGGLGESAAADAVEDGVGATRILATRPGGGEDRLARGDCFVGTELDRQLAPVRARIHDHGKDLRAKRAQDKKMEQPHAAAAQNDRDPLAGAFLVSSTVGARKRWDQGGQREYRGLAQAAQDAGSRLEKDRIEVVEAVGNPPRADGDGARAHQDPLREAAGFKEVLAKGCALRLRTGPAVEAGTAGDVVGDHDTVSRRETGDALADRDHLSHHFVSEDRSGRDGARRQLEEIGAAKPAPAHTQDQLPRARNGRGEIPHLRLAAAVDRQHLHRAVSFHQMERRIHRRFPRRIELRFWRPGEAQGHAGYTTNISKSGLFLGSATGLMPGERLRLEIVDRENGFFAEGRVARVHRVDLALRHIDQPGVGVRFLLPEELVEDLVPLARQFGPAAQSGKAVESGPFTTSDRRTVDAFAEGSAGANRSDGSADSAGSDAKKNGDPVPVPVSIPAPEPALSRDKVVPVSFVDSSAFLSTFHRDITAGGLFVSTATPMALQETVWIEMHLPIAGDRPKLFAARVIQRFDPAAVVLPGRNVLAGMAVQFIEPEKVLAELRPLVAVLRR